MSAQTAAQRMDAMEATIGELSGGVAAILAAMQAQTASPAKASPAKATSKPATRKAAQAKAQAKVAATARKAKAAGTHRVLPQGATSTNEVHEVGGRQIMLKLVNANGHRVSLVNGYGKPERSLTADGIAWLAEHAEEVLAIVDAADAEHEVGAYRLGADEDE